MATIAEKATLEVSSLAFDPDGHIPAKYTGSCPPSGTHRYFFKVFALDTKLDLDDDADKKIVEQALDDHVLAYGELLGLYKKKQR